MSASTYPSLGRRDMLPAYLAPQILTFIDDPTTLARSSQVSKRWRELVSDDMAWKSLCDKHAYRRLSNDSSPPSTPLGGRKRRTPDGSPDSASSAYHRHADLYGYQNRWNRPPGLKSEFSDDEWRSWGAEVEDGDQREARRRLKGALEGTASRRPKVTTYRSHFKQRYMVETAWRSGGKAESRSITPDQGVVTSLHLTDKYIVVALDNAKIHVFDTNGEHQKTLQGHVMGVWAMVPWEDVLISGGCDRDVRVWNMKTGYLCRPHFPFPTTPLAAAEHAWLTSSQQKRPHPPRPHFNSALPKNVRQIHRNLRLAGHDPTHLGHPPGDLQARARGPSGQRALSRDPRRPHRLGKLRHHGPHLEH